MKPELVDPVEWKELTDQFDDEFGSGVSKALLADRAPVTISRGDTKSFYLVPRDWVGNLEEEKTDFEVYSLGIRMGDLKEGRFRLSLQILNELAELTDKILVVSRQGAEAFTYSRSIIKESVIRLDSHLKRGQRVIVLNKDSEVLGLASLSVDGNKLKRLASDRLVGKNLVDIGAYLRGA
ncbi:MAG: hypothetical protein ACFFEA_01080 [Candidatus Thorarchaeota archaeon]